MRPTDLALAVAIITVSTEALAQDTVSISRDFARAIITMAGFGTDTVTLRPGALPPRFPAEVIPAGATLLGSALWDVYLSMPTNSDSTRALIQRQFMVSGWKAKPPNPRDEVTGGFVESGSRPIRGIAFCQGARMIGTDVRRRMAGGSFISMRLSGQNEFWNCDPPPSNTSLMFLPSDIKFPVLTPPPGAQIVFPAFPPPLTSSSDDRLTNSSSTGLITELSCAQILAHYAAQLTANGWTATPAATNEDGGVQRVTGLDRRGRRVTAELTDVRIGPNRHELLLRARADQTP